MAPIPRRQFLREGGALLGAAALAPLPPRVSGRTPHTNGTRARRLGAMGADKRAAFVMREMAKLHPRVAEFVQGSTAVVWEDDRWALGDFAYFKPGQIGEFFPHIQQPEGRLHFAGDTVGALPGWMQGAFASGALAARRIAASP